MEPDKQLYPSWVVRKIEEERDKEAFRASLQEFKDKFAAEQQTWRISERFAQALLGDKEEFQKAIKAIQGRWDNRRTEDPASQEVQWRTQGPARDSTEGSAGGTEFNDAASSSAREGSLKRHQREESEESEVHINMVLRKGDYKVRDRIMQDIKNRMNVEKFDIDCFASEQMHQADTWWGPQSPVGVIDAFKTNWGRPVRNLKLWINPPFNKMEQVVDKMLDERCNGYLLAPRIPEARWMSKVTPFVKKKI